MSQDCPQTLIGNIQSVSKGCTTLWSTSYNLQGHLSEIQVSIKDQVADTISGLRPTHIYIVFYISLQIAPWFQAEVEYK